jgi:hypothetical protein
MTSLPCQVPSELEFRVWIGSKAITNLSNFWNFGNTHPTMLRLFARVFRSCTELQGFQKKYENIQKYNYY